MKMTSHDIMKLAIEAIEERKGMDVVALDLADISLIADYFIICHGNSDVQVKTITTEIRKKMADHNVTVKNIEGQDTARWVLIDLGDVIVHVFHREDREFYNLERLWSDAKAVELA